MYRHTSTLIAGISPPGAPPTSPSTVQQPYSTCPSTPQQYYSSSITLEDPPEKAPARTRAFGRELASRACRRRRRRGRRPASPHRPEVYSPRFRRAPPGSARAGTARTDYPSSTRLPCARGPPGRRGAASSPLEIALTQRRSQCQPARTFPPPRSARRSPSGGPADDICGGVLALSGNSNSNQHPRCQHSRSATGARGHTN